MMPRFNEIHWEGLIFVEMFLAGIAAGAYVTAAILELLGRGRSPVARAAHLLAFPLLAFAGILLIVDLSRPERFWHMVVQSERGLPMIKNWSPMSLGSWGVLVFSGFAFVSFVDALIDRGTFALGPWRRDRTLHGHRWGLIWALMGAGTAIFVSGYSGVLLSVTEMPGWRDSTLISALFVATAAATGMAALVLIQALRGRRWIQAADDLVRANVLVVVWQLLLLLLFVMTLGPAASVFLQGTLLLGLIGAALLGGIALVMLRFGQGAARLGPSTAALAAAFVLAGGFLVRYAVVMGPQYGH